MRTIEQTFQQLTALISDQTRDLALAIAELRAVEAERDKLKLTESFAVAGWNKAVIERDKARQSLRAAEQEVEELDTLCNDFRRANSRLVADLAAATQRDDTAETDSVNSNLRTVTARLVADLAAAAERLNHAESILMQ